MTQSTAAMPWRPSSRGRRLASVLPTPYEMAANYVVYYEFVVLMVSNDTLALRARAARC